MAVDCDEGANGVLTYTLSGLDADMFRVDENGDLYPVAPLDYDNQQDAHTDAYHFTIEARDGGSPSNSATATVAVVLMNINDEAPMFQPDTYTYYVDENAQQDYSIGTVYASDTDGDGISYAIAGGNTEGNFDIDRVAGIVDNKC